MSKNNKKEDSFMADVQKALWSFMGLDKPAKDDTMRKEQELQRRSDAMNGFRPKEEELKEVEKGFKKSNRKALENLGLGFLLPEEKEEVEEHEEGEGDNNK